MNILFFDTETNGLPLKWKSTYQDIDNWPRVLSISWATYSDENLLTKHSYIIKPNGFTIDNNSESCKVNKITQEIAMEDGVNFHDVLYLFRKDVELSDLIVSHNMEFDWNVIRAEFLRDSQDCKDLDNKQTLCTKTASTDFCKLPNKYGKYGYKWPKLGELHSILFNEDFIGHNSQVDTDILVKCFSEMKRLKII